MKIKKKIISGLLTATTLVSLCAFSAGAVSTDKKFSVEDATLIQKNVVGMTTFDEKQIKLYDLNKDGVITVVDSTLVQKIIVGLIKEPTEEQPTTAESTTEPTTEAVTEPTTEAVTEPTTEAVTEPTTEAVTEPTTEAVTEPTTEAVTEPTTEAVTEPTTVPKPTTVPTGIKLNKTDIVLGTTESYALSTTVTNGNLSQVTFSTGNKKIATVDENGKITAVGVGTSKITAKTYNGKTASCTVTVKKLADSITLNKTSITLGVGEKYDLNSSIPNNTAAYYRLYYSNNTSIAPVQKAGGLVTAKTAGTTTIRCKLSNGKEAICKVTVKSAPSRVTVSDKSATLKVGQSKTLKATLNNNAYSYRSTWTSSNTYVATVNSTGKISAKSQGTATITYKTYNGKTASCKLTVSGSVAKCIDVSTWQGSIDFNKVKSAGYNYVIIRAGYGKEKSQKDNMFETNYKNAKSAGLKVGAYWFSYAMSPSTATAEADACLSCIKGKKFELPVYYDMEYQPAMSTSNSNYTKMAVNFCNKLKSNGFKSGVYSSASVYDYLLNRTTLKNNGISIWNAEWYIKPSITCDVWQYSDNGRINGISTNVDLNYIYNLNIVR
nr:GH25 family lysozyme [Ruminococcus bromii]